MDPVTHFLTGACMGRAGFNRKSALATLTMVLAAEAADIDVVWEFKGSIAALQHHRGITHSFVGVPLVAAAVLALVYLGRRLKLRLRPPPARSPEAAPLLPIRWGYLYLCAVVAAPAICCSTTRRHTVFDCSSRSTSAGTHGTSFPLSSRSCWWRWSPDWSCLRYSD